MVNRGEFKSYTEAKNLIKAQKLKSAKDYDTWYAKNKAWASANGLYARPSIMFKRTEEWKGWGDYLGADIKVRTRNSNMPVYDAAKLLVQSLPKDERPYTSQEYLEWSKINRFEYNLPSRPDQYYKRAKTWVSWEDYLGVEVVDFVDWDDFKIIIGNANAHGENITSMARYSKWLDDLFETDPDTAMTLPKAPNKTYAQWRDEWRDVFVCNSQE